MSDIEQRVAELEELVQVLDAENKVLTQILQGSIHCTDMQLRNHAKRVADSNDYAHDNTHHPMQKDFQKRWKLFLLGIINEG